MREVDAKPTAHGFLSLTHLARLLSLTSPPPDKGYKASPPGGGEPDSKVVPPPPGSFAPSGLFYPQVSAPASPGGSAEAHGCVPLTALGAGREEEPQCPRKISAFWG